MCEGYIKPLTYHDDCKMSATSGDVSNFDGCDTSLNEGTK